MTLSKADCTALLTLLRPQYCHIDQLGDKWAATLSKLRVKLAQVKDKAEANYLIREGDGNDGCYRRGVVRATNAYEALRLASRDGLICKPRNVRLADIEGDDEQAYLCDYDHTIFCDACAWMAEASYIGDNDND